MYGIPVELLLLEVGRDFSSWIITLPDGVTLYYLFGPG